MKELSHKRGCFDCNKISPAFTLIEIIFTIIIMAGIFTIIPKILTVASKHESLAMKQDAYFNAISLTKIASSLAWDEKNTDDLSILKTDNNIDCNTSTHIRLGSFLSANGRICHDSLSASAIGSEEGSDYQLFDDIDDFNGTSIDTQAHGNRKYTITTKVAYVNNVPLTLNNKNLTIDLSAGIHDANTSNIKKLTTTITYNGNKVVNHGKVIAEFHYNSANIGQFTLGKREW